MFEHHASDLTAATQASRRLALSLVLPLCLAFAPAAVLAANPGQPAGSYDAPGPGPAAERPNATAAGPDARVPRWSGPRQAVSLVVGASKLLRVPSPAGSVFVADPSVADVQTPGASEVFVFGRKPGKTTLFVLSRNGITIAAFTLTVELDRSNLEAAFRAQAGDLPVRLVRVPHGLILEGTVPTPAAAARLQSVAQGFV